MRTRIISGIVLVGLLAVVLLAGPLPFLGVLLLMTLLATHEFYTMMQAGGIQPAYAVGMAAAFALIADAGYGLGLDEPILLATLLLAILWQVGSLRVRGGSGGAALLAPTPQLTSGQLRQSWLNIAFTLAGVLYIGWLLRLGWFIYAQSVWWIVLALVVTTVADTGAYFVGRSLGKHKLIPWISPAKTVEGLLGGIFFTILGVLLLALLLPDLHLAWYAALLLGPLLALASVCGDLIESMFKRAAGVKDSGHLIPGHGGVLDRIDSVIITAAAVYFYITYAQSLLNRG